MKLYVWEEVLYSYTAGMIVALAPDLETALELADDQYMRSEMGAKVPIVTELPLRRGAKVEPALWYVHGGG